MEPYHSHLKINFKEPLKSANNKRNIYNRKKTNENINPSKKGKANSSWMSERCLISEHGAILPTAVM